MVIFHSSVSLPEGNNIHDMFSESPKESFPVRPKDVYPGRWSKGPKWLKASKNSFPHRKISSSHIEPEHSVRKFGHKIAKQFFLHLFAQIVTKLILRVLHGLFTGFSLAFHGLFMFLFTVSLFRKSRRCALIFFKHGIFFGGGTLPS